MAAPLSFARYVSVLRAEGLTVKVVGDAEHHTRTASGRPWGPVNGVMIHHTVTKRPTDPVSMCRTGYSGLPGPLCHGVITKDGIVHVVGYGRTNHAGGGDPAVLKRVIAEDYGDCPPTPTKGNDNGVDGNRHFYGFECENAGDGLDPWPAVQVEAIERAAAAVCRAHGWSSRSVIGHREWSDDKVDPRGAPFADLSDFREDVADRLKSKPTPSTYTVRAGDTLGAIAKRFNTTVAKLARLNGIKNPDVITPGQIIKLK